MHICMCTVCTSVHVCMYAQILVYTYMYVCMLIYIIVCIFNRIKAHLVYLFVSFIFQGWGGAKMVA